MASAPQRTCTERSAGILRSASAAASGSKDCVAATTPRVASQTTAISEEDLPKSAGEDPPLLGRVHSRTEDIIAAAEGLFTSVCARRVERGLES